MYNPISLNVVRQSLEWMGLPEPIVIHASRRIINAHGSLAHEYLAYFDAAQVQDLLAHWELRGSVELPEFTSVLNDCFCDDIHVVGSYYSTSHNKVIATLIVLPFVAEIA